MKTIADLLKRLKFKNTNRGYKCIIESLKVVDSMDGECDLYDDIYARVSKKLGFTCPSVEQAIRRSIIASYNQPYNELSYEVCKVSEKAGEPTNKDFLTGVWEYCKKNNIKL